MPNMLLEKETVNDIRICIDLIRVSLKQSYSLSMHSQPTRKPMHKKRKIYSLFRIKAGINSK